jgi:hypothetical protein
MNGIPEAAARCRYCNQSGKFVDAHIDAKRAEFEGGDFMLDFDLDVFRTQKAVEPVTRTCIERLVREACAITIAEEPRFVAKAV